MGRIFVVELEGRSYRCKFCKTHLALAEDLVSRVLSNSLSFHFHHFLFILLILAINYHRTWNSLCTLLVNRSWNYV